MRLPEQKLWDAMRNARPRGFWLQRVENLVGDGMPDVYVVHRPSGVASWVELKAPNRPARSSTRLLGAEGLNRAQVAWHLKASIMPLRSFVLIRDSAGELFLVSGTYAAGMNEWPAEEVRRHSLLGRDDGWRLVYKTLSEEVIA